jgi:hypothetical protein
MEPVNHEIKVTFVNGTHKCHKNPTVVNPGDKVVWTPGDVLVEFPRGTPLFIEGEGPRRGNDSWTVNKKPPLRTGQRFTPTINGTPTDGDIDVGND